MTESNPAFRRFHNALRIMLNLDRADLDAASVFSKDEAIAATQWAAFTCDPYRFFIKTPTPIAERLWALIESRQGQAAASAPGDKPETVEVLRQPPQGLLVSMATCLDHGFGMPYSDPRSPMDHRTAGGAVAVPEYQRRTLADMAKIHAEIVGDGYWKPARDADYAAQVSTEKILK